MNGAIIATSIPMEVKEFVTFFDKFSNFDMKVVPVILEVVIRFKLLIISSESFSFCKLYIPDEDFDVSPFIKRSITGLINAN